MSVQRLVAGEPIVLEFEYATRSATGQAELGMTIFNHLGTAAAHLNTAISGFRFETNGVGTVRCSLR